jgi:hypothetical protein
MRPSLGQGSGIWTREGEIPRGDLCGREGWRFALGVQFPGLVGVQGLDVGVSEDEKFFTMCREENAEIPAQKARNPKGGFWCEGKMDCECECVLG